MKKQLLLLVPLSVCGLASGMDKYQTGLLGISEAAPVHETGLLGIPDKREQMDIGTVRTNLKAIYDALWTNKTIKKALGKVLDKYKLSQATNIDDPNALAVLHAIKYILTGFAMCEEAGMVNKDLLKNLIGKPAVKGEDIVNTLYDKFSGLMPSNQLVTSTEDKARALKKLLKRHLWALREASANRLLIAR